MTSEATGPWTVALGDLPSAVGRDLPVSQWVKFDALRVQAFSAALGQAVPGGDVVPGMLVLSVVAPLWEQVLQVAGCGAVLNYGTGPVRFPAQARVGDQVQFRLGVVAVEPVTGGWALSADAEIATGSATVCAARILFRYLA